MKSSITAFLFDRTFCETFGKNQSKSHLFDIFNWGCQHVIFMVFADREQLLHKWIKQFFPDNLDLLVAHAHFH